MDNRIQRRLLYIMIALAFFGTVVALVVAPQSVLIILIIGIGTLAGALGFLRSLNASEVEESAQAGAANERRGRRILVQLVDDEGNELDPAIAEQRMSQARLRAGPKDTVVGVRRRLTAE